MILTTEWPMNLLWAIPLWIALSALLGCFVGAFIHAGKGNYKDDDAAKISR